MSNNVLDLALIPGDGIGPEVTAEALMERGVIVGTPSAYVDQISKFAEAGVERIMLQWIELDDIEGLEIIARDVLPHFHQ